MAWPTRRSNFPAALTGLALALAGCGSAAEMKGVTNAVPGKDYPASAVCDLLPVSSVAALLPGATIDTSLPSPDSCVYAANDADLIATVSSPGGGPGKAGPDALYDIALSDATANGADDVRAAPSLGDDGKIAINAADHEITAVWREGDTIYDLQYSGWDGRAADAIDITKRLASDLRAGR